MQSAGRLLGFTLCVGWLLLVLPAFLVLDCVHAQEVNVVPEREIYRLSVSLEPVRRAPNSRLVGNADMTITPSVENGLPVFISRLHVRLLGLPSGLTSEQLDRLVIARIVSDNGTLLWSSHMGGCSGWKLPSASHSEASIDCLQRLSLPAADLVLADRANVTIDNVRGQTLTGKLLLQLIPGAVSFVPSEFVSKKAECETVRVKLYQEKAEIIGTSPSQIVGFLRNGDRSSSLHQLERTPSMSKFGRQLDLTDSKAPSQGGTIIAFAFMSNKTAENASMAAVINPLKQSTDSTLGVFLRYMKSGKEMADLYACAIDPISGAFGVVKIVNGERVQEVMKTGVRFQQQSPLYIDMKALTGFKEVKPDRAISAGTLEAVGDRTDKEGHVNTPLTVYIKCTIYKADDVFKTKSAGEKPHLDERRALSQVFYVDDAKRGLPLLSGRGGVFAGALASSPMKASFAKFNDSAIVLLPTKEMYTEHATSIINKKCLHKHEAGVNAAAVISELPSHPSM